MQRAMLATLDPPAELQALQSIEPSYPLSIHKPALAPQQHPDPQSAKPRPGVGEVPNAQPEARLILGSTTDRPAHTAPGTWSETTRPVSGGGRASDFCSQGLRQPVRVEREVGDEPFQPAVFFFHLPESA